MSAGAALPEGSHSFAGSEGGVALLVVNTAGRADSLLDQLQEAVARGADDVRRYLASPEGQLLRKRTAQVLIVAAPLLLRSKFIRATWPGRVLGVVGGAALVVKLAEALRDWEPQLDRAFTEPSSPGGTAP
jgi:hypothetical protein